MDLIAGQQFEAMYGLATVLADADYETYSEAGYAWGTEPGYWKKAPKKKPPEAVLDPSGYWLWVPPTVRLEPLPGAGKRYGLKVVGAYNYITHETFRVIRLAYNLKNGRGPQHWRPDYANPMDLLDHVDSGGLIEGWNSGGFEFLVWNLHCVPKFGWPELKLEQLRDVMAKAAIAGYPRKLENTGIVLRLPHQKDKDGKRLIDKLTVPKEPTKADSGRCWTRETAPDDFEKFDRYNDTDIVAEAEASEKIPDLNPRELRIWTVDQRINHRGMQTDRKAIDDGIAIVEQAERRYNGEVVRITNGRIKTSNQVAETLRWLADTHGVYLDDLDEETVEEELAKCHVPAVKRILEIRAKLSFGSVKKLYGMRLQSDSSGRLRNQMAYASAHTHLWNGQDVQVLNLFKGKFNKPEQVELALQILATRNLDFVEAAFKNGPPWDPKDNEPMEALDVIANCLRSMIIAKPGTRLISADYTAIQAVVLAALAGEKWRLDVFHTHGKIYEASASMQFKVPIEELFAYKRETGKHHDLRDKGKRLELACGFAGWVGATKSNYIKLDEIMSDPEIKAAILQWRATSPWIVEFWGGQTRNKFDRAPDGTFARAYPQMFGLEGAAIKAVLEPGSTHGYRGVRYRVIKDVLYCLPPGPEGMSPLVYHEPRLAPSKKSWADPWERELSYMGWNTSKKKGRGGWERMPLYGGVQTQNVVAKVSREYQADRFLNLDATGIYNTVHHCHDEGTDEVEIGRGSVEEYLAIVNEQKPWAVDDWGRPWPVKAPGAEETQRYGKWE
jgi:DNA polymerase bacteriophage-type